ncbi:DNA annealing helicase and endonuclease ZRANB3, partial [Paramuricea clavata]
MKAIEQEVVKRRVKYIKIAGDVRSVLRGSLVHQFQTDSSTRVAILSILAASMGITLTAADHIIFSELHWTPGVMQQAEDRVHRIGQENSVLVQYLVARGTIDEVLWRMLCTKIYVTSTALNGKLQGLDVEEGSESQSKLLEAFSAWVMEDEDDGVAEDDFLFTH